MTCKTCRRTDMADTCGSEDGKACKCCGLIIIAEAEEDEETQEVHNTEEG